MRGGLDTCKSLQKLNINSSFLQRLVDGYTHELDASGAYVRDAIRWRGEAYLPDGYEIITFASEHFPALDAIFDAYASVIHAEILMSSNN